MTKQTTIVVIGSLRVKSAQVFVWWWWFVLLPFQHCLSHSDTIHMSQHTTKPTIRSVWPAKTRISLYIHPIWQGFLFIPLWIAWGCTNHVISEDCSDCVDAQADLSLRWLHKSYCRFCCALVHICFYKSSQTGPKSFIFLLWEINQYLWLQSTSSTLLFH